MTANSDGLQKFATLAEIVSQPQAWQLELVPQSGEVYNLICATSGMALDNGGSTSDGANLIQEPVKSGDSNQEWAFVYIKN